MRRQPAFLACLVIAGAALAGCASVAPLPTPTAPRPAPVAPGPTQSAAPPAGLGVVTGRLQACVSVAEINTPLPIYAAGTVTVLAGDLSWRTVSPGKQTLVYPKTVITQQAVTAGGEYRFNLAPGAYVLRGDYALHPRQGPALAEVIIKAGITDDIDVPNPCF